MSLLVKYWMPLLFLLSCSSATKLFLQKESADTFLHRERRFLFNNLQNECYQEICTIEEVREFFEDDTKTNDFWTKYLDPTQCAFPLCTENNTIRCVGALNLYKCICKPGFTGARCEKDSATAPLIEELRVTGGSIQSPATTHQRNSPTALLTAASMALHPEDPEVDNCAPPSPCPIGYRCVNGRNQYTCVCPEAGCLLKAIPIPLPGGLLKNDSSVPGLGKIGK